jgi:cytochrome c peroxidase
MNQLHWSKKFNQGNCRFLTKRLWGAANEPPFFHNGQFTTLRQSVLTHSGKAIDSRRAFEELSAYERDSVIEFLKTLQVLAPGTKDRIVDEKFQPRKWAPNASLTTSHSAVPERTRATAPPATSTAVARHPREKNP